MRALLWSVVVFVSSAVGRQCTQPPPGALIVKPNTTVAGEFVDLGMALNALPADNSSQVVFVYPGVYQGQVNISRQGPVKIMGYTRNTFDFAQNTVTLTHSASLATAGSDDLTGTLRILPTSSNVSLYNLDVRNTFGIAEVNGQAIALSNYGNRVGVYGCRLYSYQDTLYTNQGNHVYLRSYIEGGVDFIFGRHSQAYFEGNTIASKGAGCVTASGREANDTGIYLFNQNTVIAARDAFANETGNVFLGRPWGGGLFQLSARSIVESLTVVADYARDLVDLEPGDARTDFILFGEYNSFGLGVAHAQRANFSTILTQAEAARYSIASTVGSDWREWVDSEYLLPEFGL
ncbi:pectin lyase fold/virulence factor [Mycena sp. CBHHK59/15]|nr:pectin lyase fold/virulence factor [Mycena sp. CBHHK59/15]